MNFKDKTVLITGGSGFIGRYITKYLLTIGVKKIIIYSRDESKHAEMRKSIFDNKDVMRYYVGDVRDRERLQRALTGVDYVIHAAALKRVETAETDPNEFVKTNILGSINVIECSIDREVKKAILISSDKACSAITLYGYTKAVAERIFQQANVYSKNHAFKSCVVRYGNVAGSTGSIIPFFKEYKEERLPVTDYEMTRFWIDPEEAVKLIVFALEYGMSGEIFIPKLPSFKIVDLVKSFEKDYKIIGIRNIEKLHEEMIAKYEKCFDLGKYYVVTPNIKLDSPYNDFKEMPADFNYVSNINKFMTVEELREKIK